jgi:predicted signal transduction protein with EAL and GGDEF domain
VLLDLDQFNPISDSFGHAVGDMVREISKRLNRCLREADAPMQGSFRTAPGEPAVDPDTHPVAGAHRSAAPALVPLVLKSGGVADTVRRCGPHATAAITCVSCARGAYSAFQLPSLAHHSTILAHPI